MSNNPKLIIKIRINVKYQYIFKFWRKSSLIIYSVIILFQIRNSTKSKHSKIRMIAILFGYRKNYIKTAFNAE